MFCFAIQLIQSKIGSHQAFIIYSSVVGAFAFCSMLFTYFSFPFKKRGEVN
jgi:hypothetical protein